MARQARYGRNRDLSQHDPERTRLCGPATGRVHSGYRNRRYAGVLSPDLPGLLGYYRDLAPLYRLARLEEKQALPRSLAEPDQGQASKIRGKPLDTQSRTSYIERAMDFREVDSRYTELKRQHRSGTLST